MDMNISLFELLASCGGIMAAIAGAWIHMRISVATLKTEIHYLKKEVAEEKEGNKHILDKVDKIFAMLSGIKSDIAGIKGNSND